MFRKLPMIVALNAVLQDGGAPASGGAAAVQTPAIPIQTEFKEVDYHFKKEKIKNEKNEVIGEGKKHPSIKKKIPVPTMEGVLAIVQNGGKQWELLQDVMTDAIFNQGRRQLNALRDNEPQGSERQFTDADIPDAQLTWDVIANLPKSERRGPQIADEDFDVFFNDYRAIMPKATGKDLDRIEKHIGIYKKKFSSVRTDKKALGVLNDALAVYAANTGSMEDNQEVYEYLKKRVESLMQEEDKILADAL
jgi:hypothetical protein